MRILGIDPGLATMGWSILEAENGKMKLIDVGALITYPEMNMPTRLMALSSGIRQLLTQYAPDEAAFEELFFAKNITTAFAVGQARGVAVCACAEFGLPIYEYTPMQIKQAVAGYGLADKKQMQQMVKLTLGMDDIIRPDDAADAVAAAITHASAGRAREQFRMA